MPRFIPALVVLGVVSLWLAAWDGLATAQGVQHPPLFFREEWKLADGLPNINTPQEPEHAVVQGDVANPNLEVRVYGDKSGPVAVKQPANNNLTYVMTLLCTTECAITLRDRNSDVDLTGLATIHWRTKVSGFHLLRPIVKLADGTWLVGDHATAYSSDWVESEIQLADVRWRVLDIARVVEGKGADKWAENPNLSRVEEVGFTDLMPGGGHGAPGSRVDWIEVYGKPVPRASSRTAGNSR
jgi:hypothetical protein